MPVTRCFGEGLSPHEHFVDARDLRAYAIRERSRRVRAAAMERRLFRALRGVEVVEDDCGTTEGVTGCRARGGVCRRCSGGRTGLEAARALSAAAALLPAGLLLMGSYCGPGRVEQPPSLEALEVLLAAPAADRALLAPCEGIVDIDRASSRIWIAMGASKRSVRIRDLAWLEVESGDWVACGDALTAGTPSPHDQLRIRGPEWLAASLAEQLIHAFALKRDALSLLDVGLLVRAMLSRVRVLRPQGTRSGKGAIVTREVLDAANVEASTRGRAAAVVVPALTPLSVLGR